MRGFKPLFIFFFKFKGDVKILKGISEILLKKELFDKNKYEFIEAVAGLEIENFLTEDEQTEIVEEVKMTPKAQFVVMQAIHEVNQKTLAEREEAGMRKGMQKGIKKGKSEAMLEVAKSLKNIVEPDVLSRVTGVTVEKIQKL